MTELSALDRALAVLDTDSTPERERDMSVSPWIPVDLAAVAAAGLDPIEPDVFWRRDGRGMFYSGKLNVVFAAPEAGKSWIAILAIDQLIQTAALGDVVAVYIDYEDDARSYLVRLQAAGITPEQAAEHTRYYSAATAIRTAPGNLEGLDTARLVVIDTTNSAMTLDDLDPISNADALAFINHVRRLRNGSAAAWLLLDHEPISTSAGRKQAIGAQSKLGAVDGAQYRASAVKQPRPGSDGAIAMHLTKDRAGGVRQWASAPDEYGIQHAATIFLNARAASGHGRFDWTIIEPQSVAGDTELREAVLDVTSSSMSKNKIRELVRARGLKRKNEIIDSMVMELAADGDLDADGTRSFVTYQRTTGEPQGSPGDPPENGLNGARGDQNRGEL